MDAVNDELKPQFAREIQRYQEDFTKHAEREYQF
jgi:hypothetical protein